MNSRAVIPLSKRFAVAYQADLVDIFEGTHGVRDEAALDAALASPECPSGGDAGDLWDRAAGYAARFIQGKPFVDANTQLAAVAMGAFLDVNCAPLRVDEHELAHKVQAMADGTLTPAELAGWLREHAPRT